MKPMSNTVGFVEHEKLDVAELEPVGSYEVEQAARRGDQDFDACRLSVSIWRPIGTPPIASAEIRPRPRP